MQTLLNVTNANVCAIMLVARSFLATASGISTHDRSNCGKKASDSVRSDEEEGDAELRYSRTLYGEKLWRWSRRDTWWKKVCSRNGWPYLCVLDQNKNIKQAKGGDLHGVHEGIETYKGSQTQQAELDSLYADKGYHFVCRRLCLFHLNA